MSSFVAQPLSSRSSCSLGFDIYEGVALPAPLQVLKPISIDRPFVCEEPGCGHRFNRKFTLSEHKKTHTGEKPYVCPLSECSRCFSTSGNLARHKRLHASLKPFECHINGCKRSFPSQEKLNHHIKIHTGRKTHMCRVTGCTKTFSTAGNLTRHNKSSHPKLIKTLLPSYLSARPSPELGRESSLQFLPAHQTDHTPSPNRISAAETMSKRELVPQVFSPDSIELLPFNDELSGFHMSYAFTTKSAQGVAVAPSIESTVSDIARCSMSVLDEVIEFELTKNV